MKKGNSPGIELSYDYLSKLIWYYCDHCKMPVIQCSYCKNFLCSGSGCEKCHELFTLALKYIDEKKAPKKKDCKRFAYKFNSGSEEKLLKEIFGDKKKQHENLYNRLG